MRDLTLPCPLFSVNGHFFGLYLNHLNYKTEVNFISKLFKIFDEVKKLKVKLLQTADDLM